MKIVVTGGSGFIGSTIALQLLREGHDVVLLDRIEPGAKGGLPLEASFVKGDVRDRDLLLRVFEGAEEVYHLSGLLGTAELQTRIAEAIDINIASTARVFEVATTMGIPRLFYPVKPTIWLNAYTITKAAAEQFARMFNEYGKTQICALRYFNVYGPGQALFPIRKIVPAFAVQAMRGLPLETFGNGEQEVDMVFSRDVADLTIRFTRSCYTDDIPDCGSGRTMTVNDVARSVNEYFGNKAGAKYLPMRPGEWPDSQLAADLGPISGVLGDVTMTLYEDGLAETLDWYARLSPEMLDRTAAFYGWDRAVLAS